MNILYILGNGFDKAQGMATSYHEFYENLKKQSHEGCPDLFLKMLQEIREDKRDWSDMEFALGQFTKETTSASEFENTYEYLSECLRTYLQEESDKLNPTEAHKKKVIKNIFAPVNGLIGLDTQRYRNKAGSLPGGKVVNIVTLNYTDTAEHLLDIDGNFPKTYLGNPISSLIHVHGILDDTMIIGVDNIDQIANEEFKTNENIKDFIIKIQSNTVMKETRHQSVENLIRDAHVIVLYGVSLGDTDGRWWRLIGSQILQRRNLLIIFHVFNNKGLNVTTRWKLGPIERQKRKLLAERMGITENDDFISRVFIPVNSKIFTPE